MIKDESSEVRSAVVNSLSELKEKDLLIQIANNEDEDGRIRAAALRAIESEK